MLGAVADIRDILIPPLCPLCSAGRCAPDLCQNCLDRVTPITGPICTTCGMPFESKEGPERLCGECAASARPFESARSAALYDGAILDAVRLLKYHSRFEFVKPLSRLLVEALRGHGIESDAVVMPVPLHEKKLRERCFNQSLLMARGVARAFSLGLDYTTLVRSRPTASQTGLKADERRENVRGAFIVIAPERVKGKTVLLVDDVYTTGSTIAECSKVLKKAGARTRVMTVARSV